MADEPGPSAIWQAENKRNTDNAELFKAMLVEFYGDIDVCVAGHHIIFTRAGNPAPQEIPSADALIFDHEIAEKVWGAANYKEILTKLALEPVATRDNLLQNLYSAR